MYRLTSFDDPSPLFLVLIYLPKSKRACDIRDSGLIVLHIRITSTSLRALSKVKHEMD